MPRIKGVILFRTTQQVDEESMKHLENFYSDLVFLFMICLIFLGVIRVILILHIVEPGGNSQGKLVKM